MTTPWQPQNRNRTHAQNIVVLDVIVVVAVGLLLLLLLLFLWLLANDDDGGLCSHQIENAVQRRSHKT